MKKIKWTIMAFVIAAGICSAFATRPRPVTSGLYYYNGQQYLPAGTEGINFVCITSPEICTYILSGGRYVPYETMATYTPVNLSSPAEAASKEKK
ncbi:MAG TPA: hypothetical protein VN616_02220 [Puia sp.]|nr:hypothetical protein [Puia sp.]